MIDHHSLAATIVALSLSTLSASAARADVTHTSLQFRGDHAQAELVWSDGCIDGWLYVAGGASVTHERGGGPVTTALAYAWYNTIDRCTGEVVRAYGSIEGGTSIDSFSSATLDIPMTIAEVVCREDPERGFVCDTLPTGEIGALHVELSGEGAAEHGVTITSSAAGSFRSVSHEVGTTRQAIATASFVFGGRDHVEGWITSRALLGSSVSSAHSLYR